MGKLLLKKFLHLKLEVEEIPFPVKIFPFSVSDDHLQMGKLLLKTE
jgi:hypothetical protein